MACWEMANVVLKWDATAATGAAVDLRQMITRARSGDAVAFEQLITLYERPVLRTAWRMLGDREAARDAAQEVFVRFFKYLHRFREGNRLQPWLYRIVTNVCRDISRRRRRERAVFVDMETAQADVDSFTASGDQEQSALAAHECAVIIAALETLRPREREAIVLRDIEGLTTAETAKTMGCLQMTVRTHLSRARVKIKEFRDSQGGGTRGL